MTRSEFYIMVLIFVAILHICPRVIVINRIQRAEFLYDKGRWDMLDNIWFTKNVGWKWRDK